MIPLLRVRSGSWGSGRIITFFPLLCGSVVIGKHDPGVGKLEIKVIRFMTGESDWRTRSCICHGIELEDLLELLTPITPSQGQGLPCLMNVMETQRAALPWGWLVQNEKHLKEMCNTPFVLLFSPLKGGRRCGR